MRLARAPHFHDPGFTRSLGPTQEHLARLVLLEAPARAICAVGALVGVSSRGGEGAWAAAVICEAAEPWQVIELKTAQRPPLAPYRPGAMILTYGPAMVAALEQIATPPDLLMVLGHGVMHPRRCGIASHIGVLFELPTIGVAEAPIGGWRMAVVPGGRGRYVYLDEGEDRLGALLRTQEGKRPIVVSPGHRMDLPTALNCVLSLCGKYRMPEPLRMARREAKRARGEARVS